MGKPKRPIPVKLIIGMLAKDRKLFNSAERFFIKEFGKIDYSSPLLLFNHTDYYTKEMGRPLKRKFISFGKLINPEHISKIKLITNSIEERFAIKKQNGLNRRLNIDPGYISASKLILATTKDYFHRIYLNKGVFAEITLTWKKGGFQPFDWTYPDYRSREYIEILNSIRNTYMNCIASS